MTIVGDYAAFGEILLDILQGSDAVSGVERIDPLRILAGRRKTTAASVCPVFPILSFLLSMFYVGLLQLLFTVFMAALSILVNWQVNWLEGLL